VYKILVFYIYLHFVDKESIMSDVQT